MRPLPKLPAGGPRGRVDGYRGGNAAMEVNVGQRAGEMESGLTLIRRFRHVKQPVFVRLFTSLAL
jgi:hypothetical protein